VLDALLDVGYPGLPRQLAEALPLSHTGQIGFSTEPVSPELPIFGAEPPHDWCYYFEKAELARQQADWQKVAALGDEAFSRGEHPNTWMERLPFIEGYAHIRDWDKARQLTEEFASVPEMAAPACALWLRVEQAIPLAPSEQVVVDEVQAFLECP
jgi:hypothetical protein